MSNCKYCGKQGSHYCENQRRQIEESEDSSFIASAVIGAVTNSAILGGLLGGDLVGGIVGDFLNGGDLED